MYVSYPFYDAQMYWYYRPTPCAVLRDGLSPFGSVAPAGFQFVGSLSLHHEKLVRVGGSEDPLDDVNVLNGWQARIGTLIITITAEYTGVRTQYFNLYSSTYEHCASRAGLQMPATGLVPYHHFRSCRLASLPYGYDFRICGEQRFLRPTRRIGRKL